MAKRHVRLALLRLRKDKVSVVEKDSFSKWIIRLIKGIFIGAGFILPGTSGGTFAVIFGTFEPMVKFFSNIKKDFKENLRFFLPIVIGSALGVLVFSTILTFFFAVAEVPLLWFFIGLIVGSIPALWKQAGNQGRTKMHLVVFGMSLVMAFGFLFWVYYAVEGSFPLNLYTWLMAGGIIGVGTFIPGFSSANILLVLGVYDSMLYGIANVDFAVIIPIFISALVVVLTFSKLIAFVLKKAYGAFFHGIIGLVVASTFLIVPLDYEYMSIGGLVCLGVAVLGFFVARLLIKLEDKQQTTSR